MKKLAMGAILLAAVLTFSAQTSRQATPTGTSGRSADANAITEIENGWPDAMVKKDVSFMDRVFADDLTDIGPDGALNTKRQDVEDLKSGKFVLESGTVSDLQPRVYGDFAVVTGIADLRGQYSGQDITGRYRYTDTYVKQNGQWKIVATQATKIMNPNDMK